MLARRRQTSGATTVTVDDAGSSAADAPTPTGRDRRSPLSTSRRSLPPTASSGVAVAASRRRVGAGRYRRRTPTSSPEPAAPEAASAASSQSTGARSRAAAGKSAQLKYKRVKDSTRQQLAGRKPDTSRQEDIFDD